MSLFCGLANKPLSLSKMMTVCELFLFRFAPIIGVFTGLLTVIITTNAVEISTAIRFFSQQVLIPEGKALSLTEHLCVSIYVSVLALAFLPSWRRYLRTRCSNDSEASDLFSPSIWGCQSSQFPALKWEKDWYKLGRIAYNRGNFSLLQLQDEFSTIQPDFPSSVILYMTCEPC